MKLMTTISDRPVDQSRESAARAIAALLLLAAGAALVAGCGGQSGARADAREIRLTQDGVFSGSPRFSPDGKTIAFFRRTTEGQAMYGTFLMPASGGPAQRISPDTLGLIPVRWTADGKAVLCVAPDGRSLYRIGIDRSVRFLGAAAPLSRFADVSDDGDTRLAVMFNQDNYDVMARWSGGEVETLLATPDWELGAVLGPGPKQVTVVAMPTYMSPLTTISVRTRHATGAKPLPLPEGFKHSPFWSPDGRTLAYVASSNGQLDLWLYDATTARAAPAIQDPQDCSSPAWSPDGEWLAFSRSVRTSHLFLGEPGDPNRRQLTHGPANDYEPTVSPDGRWIAFQRKSAPGTPGADVPSLCVMPASGGEVKPLDLKGLSLPTKGAEIAWSKDGEHIAFSAREASTNLDVYRIRRDGTGLLRVTVDAEDEIDPRWSPDGRRIAYTRVGGGETQVVVVPSNGGVSQVLSDQGVVSEYAAWSPDGKGLAYLALRQDGGHDVWITPSSAPGRKRLALSHAILAYPWHWTPDGRHLILMRGKSPEWYVTELDLATGTERRIATEAKAPSGLGVYLKFEPAGEPYRSLLCPAGMVMTDGEQTGDLFKVRTDDLMKARKMISTGGSTLWFARAGWVASF